jgi:uncharacterized protein YggE
MGTDEAHTTISVRAEARRTVPPDQVQVFTTVQSVADTVAGAKAAADEQLGAVLEELVALGATAHSIETARAPFTWSHHSMHTHPERRDDKHTGEHGPTGRHVTSHALSIMVRDFDLVRDVETVLTSRDSVAVHRVVWTVDHDNGVWAQVRAEAIHAALLKGQDYATALGGRVIAVPQVADAGLLDGPHERSSAAYALGGGHRRDSDDASLEPEPQILTATIDARLTAVIPAAPSNE